MKTSAKNRCSPLPCLDTEKKSHVEISWHVACVRWLRFQTMTFTFSLYVVRVCMCLCQEIMVYSTDWKKQFSRSTTQICGVYLFRYVVLYLLLSLVFLFIYNYVILKPMNCPLMDDRCDFPLPSDIQQSLVKNKSCMNLKSISLNT